MAAVIVGYDTCPHVDQRERGLEAGEIWHRILTQGLRLKMWLARRPLLPNILRQLTERPPMADAISLAHEFERGPKIVSVSVAAGFPYSDVPEAGFTVLAVSDGEAGPAKETAEGIAEAMWQRRHEFQVSLPGIEEAVRQAVSGSGGLTILVDVGDNLGGGSPGDGTFLLAELLRQGARNVLVLLPDLGAVDECIKAGVRQRVRLQVGGKIDTRHGSPVAIEGTVRTLSSGVFRNIGPMREGMVDDQGRTAVVDCGGVTVVLTERRMFMWNLQQLRSLGIEPTLLSIIVVKAAIAYRAAYVPIAQRIIEVDTPGISSADVRRFTYTRLQRPIFPLDPL